MTTASTDPTQQTPTAVVGATGQQGGAVVTALRAAGAAVRALTRDVDGDAGRRLQSLPGVEVVAADQDDPASLVAAFTGVDRAFLMTTFTGEGGTEAEVEHGVALGDAAQAAGVREVVYTSVGGADRATGIPHFDSKWRVEQHLATLDLRVSVIWPVFFMENFATILEPTVEDGTVVVRLPLPGDVPLQLVAVRDIGRACAVALLDADRVPGGAVEIAGDELTGEQVASAYGEAQGRPARYVELPVSALGDADSEAMFRWFAQTPAYQADRELTRRLVPDVQDLAAWLAG